MRSVALPTTLAAAVIALAGSAEAAADRDALIRPGVGIGKVRLGMTLTQVKRALGQQFLVNKRVRRGFGATYVELGWDYSWWRVGFIVRQGRYRAVLIGTVEPRERTSAGIGPGSTVRALRRRMRVLCRNGPEQPWPAPPYRDPTVTHFYYCTARQRGGRQTVFLIHCRVSFQCPSYVVGEVVVREPF
jgi:hypothetical protein